MNSNPRNSSQDPAEEPALRSGTSTNVSTNVKNDLTRSILAGSNLTGRNIETIARLEAAADAQRSRSDVVVDAITTFCGSMAFVYVHLIWFGGWIVMNVLPFVTKKLHFDPYPFELLTLTVSLESIFLSTFILISQNRQNKIEDRRNHLDLQINLLDEQETTKMLTLLKAIADKLDVPWDDDPELAELEQHTEPENLVAQIKEVIERKAKNKKEHQGS